MDASTVLLPSQLSVYVWAPITLITFGCVAWLMALLRDEPETVIAAMPDASLVRRRRVQARDTAAIRQPRRPRSRKQRLLPRERYLQALQKLALA
ncbi:MAG TPA: hypothetical protein VLI06_13760 [Solimonas sp.]|nr:hypothetical protein [Solimonas sp.]